jgi:hypothetical protein
VRSVTRCAPAFWNATLPTVRDCVTDFETAKSRRGVQENVVRRIAAECTFIDERGAVGFSPETGRRDRAPVRRTIPATAPTKAKPPAKAAAAAVIAAAQFWEQVKKASVVGYFRLQRPAGNRATL